MKRGRSILGIASALFVVGFSLTAMAELKDNPYQIIIDRNPFGLRPIPPPPVAVVETNPPPTPPPDIKLTGITTLLGSPRVMLQVEDKQAKGKFLFPTLSEGESENGITIVSVDTENMKVRVRNGDAETTLDFKNNGVKPGGGAVASTTPIPHAAGLGLGAAAMPGAIANPAANAAANSGRGAIISGGANMTTPGINPGMGGVGALPARPMRSDSLSIVGGGAGGSVYNPNAPAIPPPAPTMTREEAEARIELARQNLLKQQQSGQLPAGVPSPNILPPTRLQQALGQPPSLPNGNQNTQQR
jgi:hypothetical protein